MRNFNKIIMNFILPVFLLFIAFRLHSGLGWLIIFGFFIFIIFKSRSDIFAHIGNLRYMKGDEDAAFNWIKRAVKLKESKPRVITGYGFLLLKQGEIDEAEKAFNRVINSSTPEDEKMNARIQMTLVEWKRGRLYHATNQLQSIYENFKNTNLFINLGFFLILKGNLENALEFNKEAYDYNNTNSFILNNLGYNYLLMEEFSQADEIYGKLMKNEPHFAEAYYYYGLVKLGLGDREQGKSLIDKALNYRNSVQSILTKDEVVKKIEELKA